MHDLICKIFLKVTIFRCPTQYELTVCICMILSYGIETVTMSMTLEWFGEKLGGQCGDYLLAHTILLCKI